MIAHWDEVGGPISNVGQAAGTVATGVARIHLAPAMWSSRAPGCEEILFVLAGSGLSSQNGESYEVRGGDCVVHLAEGPGHALFAGDDGLDVVALCVPGRYAWAPEPGAERPELPAAPSPRPPWIVNLADVAVDPSDGTPPEFESEWRDLGRAAGSERAGMSYVRIAPGRLNVQHHCHSAEEEIFVMLEGEGTLELVPSPNAWEPEEQRIPVRAGHVVARPAGTRLGHAFRAGDDGLALLAYGTREPNDIAYYPRSRKLNFRGVGVSIRAESIGYWDGV